MRVDPDKLPLPTEPYRGILPFRLLDWRIFLERSVETERLGNLVSIYSAVLLYGQSGAGKSSLLNAGLIPDALRRGRAPERIRVFPEPGHELVVERISLQESNGGNTGFDGTPHYLPSRFNLVDNDERVALSAEQFFKKLLAPSHLGVPLLIFDQFEELVTLFEENPKDEKRFREARTARAMIEQLICDLLLKDPFPVKLVFGFRDDYLARLRPLFARIPNLMDQAVWLAPPHVDAVKRIVRGPFIPSEDGERGLPGHFPDELSDELAERIADGIRARRLSGVVNLSEVQTLCRALWQQPRLRNELLHPGDPAGVLQKIIESEAMAALKGFLPWDRVRALALLSNLVTQEGTRDVVSEENLIAETRRNPFVWIFRGNLRTLLIELLDNTPLLRRSLSAGTPYYELASEFLISWIYKQQQAFRKRALIVWSGVFAILSLLVIVLVVLAVSVNSQKRTAEQAKRAAEVAQEAEQDARIEAEINRGEADNLRKRSDSLVGLITFIGDDLTEAFEKTGKASLANEFKQRFAEYQGQYADVVSPTGSLDDDLKTLESQGQRLQDSGDSSGALQLYIQGADRVRKALARKDSSDSGTELWLAHFISYQALVLQTQGNLTQAMMRALEALDITRKVADRNPVETKGQSYLYVMYARIAGIYEAQGDLESALLNYRNGLNIIEKLANLTNEDSEYLQRELAASYSHIGDVQQSQGDLAGALASCLSSFTIFDKLAQKHPDNAARQHDLAAQSMRVADLRILQGNLPEALGNYRLILPIIERLARLAPDNADRQGDRAGIYRAIGVVQQKQGDVNGALAHYRESFLIYTELIKRDPANVEWQRALSSSHNVIGGAQREQGDLFASLASYRSGLAIVEKLAKQDPSNAEWELLLALAHGALGDGQRDQGDLAPALTSYRAALKIIESLTGRAPSNSRYQSYLATQHRNIGKTLLAQGKRPEALDGYQKSRAICETLTQGGTNAMWHSALSDSAEGLGDVLRDQRQPESAIKDYRDCLAIREKLAAQDPSNADWQINLSRSLVKLGNALCDQGDSGGGLQKYQGSVTIREKLTTLDPNNVSWRAELAQSYCLVAVMRMTVDPKAADEAEKSGKAGLGTLIDLKNRKALTAEQQRWVKELETKLGFTESIYQGKVGPYDATFSLRFDPGGRVSGSYVLATNKNLTLRLEGHNRRGKVMLDEYTRTRLTAHIELTLTVSGSDSRLEGTMKNTAPDNRVFKVALTGGRR